MNNVFVYCELEGTVVAEVSLELLTNGRKLANQLGCQLEAVVAGTNLAGLEKQVLPFGVDRLHIFDAPGLFPYTSLPHSSVLINLCLLYTSMPRKLPTAPSTRMPRSLKIKTNIFLFRLHR